MQWMKVSYKKPHPGQRVFVKNIKRGGGVFAEWDASWQKFRNNNFSAQGIDPNEVYWLDESEPSFTLQNVIDAFENGLYGEAVEVYIKNTYDININALKK